MRKPLTNLVALAAEWGIEVGNNVVVDQNRVGQLLGLGPDSPVAGPPYPAHPITERFRLNTAFPLARSVRRRRPRRRDARRRRS